MRTESSKGDPGSRVNRFRSFFAVRLWILAFPPLGLWFLWRSPLIPRRAKVLASCAVPLYLVVYLAGVWALLAFGFGIDTIELQDGYIPRLTFAKRLPNRNTAGVRRESSKPLSSGPESKSEVFWSGFRGADRTGVYREAAILTNWHANGLRAVWRHPCGGGFSSFAAGDGRIYTIEQRRNSEVATAYDAETGIELWRNAWETRFEGPEQDEGPRSTPTYENGRVYVLGAAGEFRCLEAATGIAVWRRNIVDDVHAKLPAYGATASPLIVDDKVIVLPGGENDDSVAAFDKATGAVIWKHGRDHQAYTSPMLVSLAGSAQLLLVSARSVTGADPRTGRELWRVPWVVPVDNAIAQPLLWGGNKLMVSGGYGLGSRAFEVSQSNSVFNVGEIWRSVSLKNKFSSSVFRDGFIYGLDENILCCIDANDGARKWKGARYGYGQLLLAGGHLVVMGEDGTLALVEATPDGFKERARFAALQGQTWNHPAIAYGKIFVRNAREMAGYAIGE